MYLVPYVTLSFTVVCYTSAHSNINKNQAIYSIVFFSVLKINGSEGQVSLKSS